MHKLILSAFALTLSTTAFAGGITLDASGSCPGEVTITASGLTGGVMLAAGDMEGSTVIPRGACSGVDLGIESAGSLFTFGAIPDSDGDGTVTFSPTLPEGACDKTMVAVDFPSCSVSAPVTFTGDVADNPECSSYTDLTDGFRNISWVYDYNRCDSGLSDGTWYRFSGDAGVQAPEVAPDTYSCGTHAPGWMEGVHPAGFGESAAVSFCNHWSSDICWQRYDIDVTNCGDFYVYNFRAPPCCSCVFCGEDPV